MQANNLCLKRKRSREVDILLAKTVKQPPNLATEWRFQGRWQKQKLGNSSVSLTRNTGAKSKQHNKNVKF